MAFRAGAEFIDMEMMQFHPTGLLVGKSIATGGLLEEGLRGAGRWPVQCQRRAVHGEIFPTNSSVATRDVVSRSSYMEIMAGRGTENGGVLIDATHMGEEFLLKNFRGMVDRCREYGFDLLHSPSRGFTQRPLPHGRRQDRSSIVDCNIEGLFVAGEDAGGVHGANRLGGNGVADSIVFGGRAGDAMARLFPAHPTCPSFRQLRVDEICRTLAGTLLDRKTGENPFMLRDELEARHVEKSRRRSQRPGFANRHPRASGDPQTAHEQPYRLRRRDLITPSGTKRSTCDNLSNIAEMIARSALTRDGIARGALSARISLKKT